MYLRLRSRPLARCHRTATRGLLTLIKPAALISLLVGPGTVHACGSGPAGRHTASSGAASVAARGSTWCGGTYLVHAGDTLSGIALHCNVTLAALRGANPGSEVLAVGRILVVPGGGQTAPPQPAHQVAGGRWYVVRAGDTLSLIAQTHSVTVDRLMRLNGLSDANRLAIGQTLRIPTPG